MFSACLSRCEKYYRRTQVVWRLSSNQEVIGLIPTRVHLWYFFTVAQTCTEHSCVCWDKAKLFNIIKSTQPKIRYLIGVFVCEFWGVAVYLTLYSGWKGSEFNSQPCQAVLSFKSHCCSRSALLNAIRCTWAERSTLTLSPSSTIGTAARSPTSTFGTDNGAMQNELNPIVLHWWTQWHCPIVSYSGELPAISLL